MVDLPHLRGPGGRPLRLAHLTTVDMSLSLLLETELRVDLAAGFDTVGISAPGPYVESITELGVAHEALPALTRSWNLARDAAAARSLVGVLRRLQLDVLHTHNPKTGVLGRIAGRLAGVPVVVNTCHGLWAGKSDPILRRWFVYTAEALAAQFSDAELYQNAEDAATLRWAVRRRRSQVVGNGVDLDRFRFDAPGRARVRRELDRRRPTTGRSGRPTCRREGIRSMPPPRGALGAQAAFVWVGPEDPDKADAISDVEGVRFLGSRSDMPAVYSAFDVFALPSYREGLSRSAMEAAACGRPMVLSDIRGCREIGDHRRHLLLVPPRDPVALTDSVAHLLSSAEDRRQLGEAARMRARKALRSASGRADVAGNLWGSGPAQAARLDSERRAVRRALDIAIGLYGEGGVNQGFPLPTAGDARVDDPHDDVVPRADDGP